MVVFPILFLFPMILEYVSGFSRTIPSEWSPSTWRHASLQTQLPTYPCVDKMKKTTEELQKLPPLVYAGEIRQLQQEIADAGQGKRFLLMGGDCAESFESFSIQQMMNQYRLLLQMSIIGTSTLHKPIVKIGRWAGQFGKPRSSLWETRQNLTLPAYQGDIIHHHSFDHLSRTPDPQRMIRAYHQSCQTLNLIRALSQGGYADLRRVQEWSLEFLSSTSSLPSSTSTIQDRYVVLAQQIQSFLSFLDTLGQTPWFNEVLRKTDWYCGHEGLLLPYEEALTRQDSITKKIYDCSGHFLWIGERTRALDSAHVEFFRGISNPIGIKISSQMTPSELSSLLRCLNPQNIPGRISLITRMGCDFISTSLPPLIDIIQQEGWFVTWICDPMHGNTKTLPKLSKKTRYFHEIQKELELFLQIHAEKSTIPGGIHLELSGEDIYECIGNSRLYTCLSTNHVLKYKSLCDPRLNALQSLELMFWLGDRYQSCFSQ